MIETSPVLEENFLKVLHDHTAGDPMRAEVKWTNLSRRQIAERLGELGTPASRQVVSQLLTKGRSADDPLNLLTPREREVIELVAEGRSNKGIGERLVITERAVQKHVTSIFMKLDLQQSDDDHRRILAVLAYMAPIKS